MTADTSRSGAAAARGAALALVLVACGGAHPAAARDQGVGGDSSTQGDSTAVNAVDAPYGAEEGGADSGGVVDSYAPVADAGPEGPALAASVCSEGYGWKSGPELITDAIGRFGGVSADGRTVAWTRTTGDLWTADRISEAGGFMAAQGLLPGSDTPMPHGRVALDSGGLLLLAVDAAGTGFVVWQRPAWGQAWALGSSPAFDGLLAWSAATGATFSEPMFGASGDAFFYLATPGTSADAGGEEAGQDATTAGAQLPVLYESRWDATSSSWGPGVALTDAPLTNATGASVRRPTGASADDRTLFFFDETRIVERAAWRNDPSSPFVNFEDVASTPEAAPNGGCSLLYFRGTDPEAGTEGINTAY